MDLRITSAVPSETCPRCVRAALLPAWDVLKAVDRFNAGQPNPTCYFNTFPHPPASVKLFPFGNMFRAQFWHTCRQWWMTCPTRFRRRRRLPKPVRACEQHRNRTVASLPTKEYERRTSSDSANHRRHDHIGIAPIDGPPGRRRYRRGFVHHAELHPAGQGKSHTFALRRGHGTGERVGQADREGQVSHAQREAPIG